MLALSHTTGYAIRALSCLHECGDGLMQVKDIGRCTGIPLPYLSKIMHSLGKSGLIAAKRGYRGGFAVTRRLRAISFYDVAVAIEGEDFLPVCLLGLEACPPFLHGRGHGFWAIERKRILRYLRQMTLADVKQLHTCGRGLSCEAGRDGDAANCMASRHRRSQPQSARRRQP